MQDVKLPYTVKPEIASSLKSIAPTDHLTNGEASLRRNELFITPFKETLRRDDWDLTDTMLIWHIATNYREIVETSQDYSGHDNETLKQ